MFFFLKHVLCIVSIEFPQCQGVIYSLLQPQTKLGIFLNTLAILQPASHCKQRAPFWEVTCCFWYVVAQFQSSCKVSHLIVCFWPHPDVKTTRCSRSLVNKKISSWSNLLRELTGRYPRTEKKMLSTRISRWIKQWSVGFDVRLEHWIWATWFFEF